MRKKLWLSAAMLVCLALLGSGIFSGVASLTTAVSEPETMKQQVQSDFLYVENVGNYDSTDVRSRALLDLNWKFIRKDVPEASAKDFDDSAWRTLNLPHDWGIEGEYDMANATAGQGGYLPAGIGWYRKTVEIPAEWRDGRQVSLAFDGVFCNSTVYVDGEKVGGLEYGWLSFSCDITAQVQGKESVTVAVKVDNSVLPSARWYTGSGIYSHVWLLSTEKVHVAENGTYVVTPGADKGAPNGDVNLETTVQNDGTSDASVRVRSTVYNKKDNSQVAQLTGDAVTVPAGGTLAVAQVLHVDNPLLWSVDAPNLYRIETEILAGDTVVDDYTTDFGFRHISYDVNGLYINGVNTELKGVANHWALGALGAAQSDNMIRYKIQMMKDMGVNCIRTAHNACPPVFYQLCDEMGMMVLDELSEGEKGKEDGDYATRWFELYWQRDYEYWIKRDRNHPSVVAWSIGNETGSQYDNTGIGAFIDQFDTSRPTTGSWIYYGVDIPGANGISERYDYATNTSHRPENIRNLPLIATEAPHTHAVRGVYRTQTWARGTITESVGGGNSLPHLTSSEIFKYDWSSSAVGSRIWPSDYDNAVSQISVRQHWVQTRDEGWRIGEFRWTGFDYLGEANYVLGGWPYRMFHSGAVDTALFEKSMYYLYQSMWTEEPMLHILPSWTHPTMEEGTEIPVWVYSNCDTVELFLNGVSLGKETRGPVGQRDALEIQFDWLVPYAPGELTAVGYDAAGNEVMRDTYKTASAPSAITLENTTGEELPVDPSWVGQVTVTTVDKDGNFYPYGENRAYYHVSGPAYIKAVDNGSPTDLENHVRNNRNAFMGLNKVFVAPSQDSGDVLFTAASILGEKRQLTSNLVSVDVQQLALRGNPEKNSFEIYYTTDGSAPDKSSDLYTGAFEVASETTVKAAVYVAGSDVPMFVMEEAFGADEGMYWEGTGSGNSVENAAYAKDAVLTGEKIKLMDFDYTAKYVNFDGKPGTVEYSYTAEKAGDYYMAVCYNNGSGTLGTSSKSMTLSVNGLSAGSYKFVANGEWDTFWSYRIIRIPLQAGENKIKFDSGTVSGANLKELLFWPVDDAYTPGDTDLLTLSGDGDEEIKSLDSGFDGKGIDVMQGGGAATWTFDNQPAGEYQVAFFYSTPNGSLREVSLSVNGVTTAFFSGKKTSPDYGISWGYETVNVYLAPGRNTLTVTAPSGGAQIGGLMLLPVKGSASAGTYIDASCVENTRLSASGTALTLVGTDVVSSDAKWDHITMPNGLIYLVHRESGKLLVSDGVTALLAEGETDGNALWRRISETEHYDYLYHVASEKVLAISAEGTLFMDAENNYLPGNLQTNRAYWYFRDAPSDVEFAADTPVSKTADAKPFFVTASGGEGEITYSVVSGPATVNASTGLVTLSGKTGTVVLKATAGEISVTHTITVLPSSVATAPMTSYLATDAKWNEIPNGSNTNFKTATGGGVTFVDFNNCFGSLEFTVTVPEAGEYYLAVSYNTAGERRFNLDVNGVRIGQYICKANNIASKTWYDNYSYHIIKTELKAGENTVLVSRDDGYAVPCIYDLLVCSTSEWNTPADAHVAGGNASRLNVSSSFDGVAYDTGNSLGTLTWNISVPTAGKYRAVIPYSSGASSSALHLAVDGNIVASTGRRVTSGGYGYAWKFVTTEEFVLPAGEDVSLALQWSGGAYLSAVRLELVEEYLDVSGADLTVNIIENETAKVYSLDVNWENDDFTFDYNAGSEGTWNPQDHTFEGAVEEKWEDKDLKITVVNHSNADVKAVVTVTDLDEEDGLTVLPARAEETLETAEGRAVADADFAEFVLTVNGTPVKNEGQTASVASVTVTFSAAE